jgi:hypothetical protein
MAATPRPHPLARGPLIDRLNHWLETAWSKGWATRPSLDPQVLWAKALRKAPSEGESGGRSAEDATDFRLRLERLCEALQNEAQLNSLGLTIAHGQLTRVIVQRLKLGVLWLKRPELLETKLAPPILVVGQMRGGTTRVHRLLAADPAHAATRFCDSWHPVPETPDLRPLWSGMTLAFLHKVDPWLDSLHPFGSTRSDEELGWLASALDHCAYEAQWRIPSFVAFSEARDPAPVYREFARILRTDAERHGNATRPRVMKVPQFAEDLGPLLAQFPDARVIVARRGAAEVLASSISFVANQMTIQSHTVDLDWIQREWERKIALRQAGMDEALAGFAGPVARVDYAALDADWESAIETIYRDLGLPLPDAARAAMRAEQRRSAATRHSRHAEDLRSFQSA